MGDPTPAALSALASTLKSSVLKGDRAGHEFRGNQWVRGWQMGDPTDEGTIYDANGFMMDHIGFTYELNQITPEDDPTLNAIRDYFNPWGEREQARSRGYDSGLDNNAINNALWSGEASPELRENIDLLRGAIAGSTTNAPMTVYRGVVERDYKDLQAGETIGARGFTSTSLLRGVAERFGDGTLMEIRLPKGSNAIGLLATPDEWGEVSGEAEVLLHDKASFRVDGARVEDGRTIYTVTYLGRGTVEKGDRVGHGFHGNQWVDAASQSTVGEPRQRGGAARTPREALETAREVADTLGMGGRPRFVGSLARILGDPELLTRRGDLSGGSRNVSLAILDSIGCTDRPSLVDEARFQTTPGDTLWTGVHDGRRATAAEKALAFTTGEASRIGGGAFGPAWYATTDQEYASEYAAPSDGDGEGGIIPSKLSPGSTTLGWITASRRYDPSSPAEAMNAIDAFLGGDGSAGTATMNVAGALTDPDFPNLRAAMDGVDALTDGETGHVMVLNRAALTVPPSWVRVTVDGGVTTLSREDLGPRMSA